MAATMTPVLAGRQRMSARELGRRGEDLGANYLTANGFVVLSRNWRCREGELDLVATDRRKLLVCEVKTRSSALFGEPAEAVTPAKIRKIRRATHAWLRRYHVGCCEVRFDLLAVLWPPCGAPRLQHVRGAF